MLHCRNFISSKMKAFTLEKVLKTSSGAQGRLGCFQLSANVNTSGVEDELGQNKGETCATPTDRVAYRTPMYIIHTQTGTVPHITPEIFKLIYPAAPGASDNCGPVPPPLQISVDSTLKFTDSLKKFQKGVGKFVGFPDLPIFLSTHDPLQPLRWGLNDKFGIALWSRHGRTGLTPERFVEVLKSYKCGLSQIISDYDIQPGVSGVKRLRKSLTRAEEYTSYVLKETSRDGCKQTGHFITIEASWFKMDEELAKKTVAVLLENQQEIEGVVIAGISERFGKGTREKSKPEEGKRSGGHEERLNVCQDVGESLGVVEKIVNILPDNLPKYAPGPFKLVQIVDLLAKGIDIFDSSVASRMADNSEVFLLDQVEAKLALFSNTVVKLPDCVNESLPERDTSQVGDQSRYEGLHLPEKPIISLKNKRYFDDFGPISKACTCYTCRKHTRSYVHHLYATDELLGPVLIQMHNLTALDRFFKIMRGIIDDSGTVEALQEKFDLVKELLAVDDEHSSDSDNIEEVKVKVKRRRSSIN